MGVGLALALALVMGRVMGRGMVVPVMAGLAGLVATRGRRRVAAPSCKCIGHDAQGMESGLDLFSFWVSFFFSVLSFVFVFSFERIDCSDVQINKIRYNRVLGRT